MPAIASKREASVTLGGREKALPTYLRRQDARFEEPCEFLALEECRRLRGLCLGQFINRGKAFRRLDRNEPIDRTRYEASGRRGSSLKIAEPPPNPQHVELGMMSRFVEEMLKPVRERNRSVLRTVESYAPRETFVKVETVEPTAYPFVFRWDRAPNIKGKREQLRGRRCRIVAHGRRTDAVMLRFEDGIEFVTSRNAIVLAKTGKAEQVG